MRPHSDTLRNSAASHDGNSDGADAGRPKDDGNGTAAATRSHHESPAPGSPGADPTWTCAAKSGVGRALSPASHLWFTLGRGHVNEVYCPWIDHAALRDLRFFVTDGDAFFSDEATDTFQSISLAAPGVPAYRLTNTCKQGRYRIEKEILADPDRDVLLQRVRFVPLQGASADLRLTVVANPRLGDCGRGNSAWQGDYNGRPMLFARRGTESLALACSAPWRARSVGYVGASGPQLDLRQHRKLTWSYTRADDGNVSLGGEIDLTGAGGEFVLALAFARSPAAAAVMALLALQEGFDRARDAYVAEWQRWQKQLMPLDEIDEAIRAGASERKDPAGSSRPDRSRPAIPPDANDPPPNLFRTGTMVLRVHRALHLSGAGVASLTIPWGEARGDKDQGGYHVVWARDLVEQAAGLLAAGAHGDARRVLHYLRATQHADGHWPQDMWLDGTAYMDGVQMDEVALPILLVDLARRESAVGGEECRAFWPMVRAAAEFLVRCGPATKQDRWENSPGYSPYTVSAEIAALLAAAEMADRERDAGRATQWRETADAWHDQIDRLMYVTGTNLARRLGIEGYYVRLAPPQGPAAEHRSMREETAHNLRVVEVVSPDALGLVRFGLRAADDPRIVNTVKAIDAATRVETPFGPSWHRYNGDYYGERDDGTPPQDRDDQQTHGRAWPLLTGERGHYELAAGRPDEARRMLAAMAGFASVVGLLPEQVWDAADLPDQGLFLGRPSRSAMPLAWAHAEYIRLLRSIRDRHVFDLPPQAFQRYVRRPGHA
jgi:glucoamylase